jgi:hypothetical protein
VIALRELNASKNSFDFACIEAIERTGHYDYTSLFAADCASKADAATARGLYLRSILELQCVSRSKRLWDR